LVEAELEGIAVIAHGKFVLASVEMGHGYGVGQRYGFCSALAVFII
jgi:hypothetical protein